MRTLVVSICCIAFLASCKKDRQDDTPPQLDIAFINTDETDRFTPFGHTLPDGRITTGYEVSFTNPGAYLVSSCNGSVQNIVFHGAELGYSVEIALGSRSAYKVYYHYLDRLKVQTGQIVAAGDTLGQNGPPNLVRFQVYNSKYGYYVCPRFYGNSSFNLAMDRALLHQNDVYATGFISTCLQDKAN